MDNFWGSETKETQRFRKNLASPDGWDAALDRGGATQDPGAAAKDRRRADAA